MTTIFSEILLFFFLQITNNIFAETSNETSSTNNTLTTAIIPDVGTSYFTIISYMIGILGSIILGIFAYLKRNKLTSYFTRN